MKLTFNSDDILRLIERSEASEGNRRGISEQIYNTAYLKDDLSPERRAEIMASSDEEGFNFDINPSAESDPSKVPAGIILVGDRGVYLMSNANDGPNDAVYANEVNPETMEFDDWWGAKNASFGGDDGTVFLAVEGLRDGLEPGGLFALDVTPSAIRLMVRPDRDDTPTP